MAESKFKLLLVLPYSLHEEIEQLSNALNTTKSQFIRDSIRYRIELLSNTVPFKSYLAAPRSSASRLGKLLSVFLTFGMVRLVALLILGVVGCTVSFGSNDEHESR